MSTEISPVIRRFAAAGLLVAAALLFASVIVEPLISVATGAIDRLQDARFECARLEALAAAPVENSSELLHRRQRLQSAVLIAQDEGRARALLQAHLTAILAESNLAVNTIHVTSSGEDITESQVALTVAVRGAEAAWLDALDAITQSRPALFIEKLEITAPEVDTPGRQLDGTLVVSALWLTAGGK